MWIMYKVKKYIKCMLKRVWNILPIPSGKKAVFRYKWQMKRTLRYLQRDISSEMCKELESQYKSIGNSSYVVSFEEKAENLRKRYKKVHVLRNYILNIGPMCFIYYSLCEFLERCPADEKVILLLYDGKHCVYESDDPHISNRWLQSKIRELVEIVDVDTAPFWGYMAKEHRDFCVFDTLDTLGRILHPDRERILHQKEYRYPSKKYMVFSKREKNDGEAALQKMGLKKGAYFCFFSRSNEYHERYFDNHGTDLARHTALRNSSIELFVQAIDRLELSELKAVRVGAVDSRKVAGENIFDYTNTCRDDFLDFFVMGQAKFFVGDASGIDFIPWLMNVPQAITNNFSFFWRGSEAFNHNSQMNLTIYKKWWDRKKKRYLTLREILNLSGEYGMTDEAELHFYDRLGIDFHANTLDEISDLIYEMNLRLDGKWEDDEEMLLLREKYWALLNAAMEKAHPVIVLWDNEPGSLFLKRNKWLLD